MKTTFLIPFVVAAVMSSCKLESSNCPRQIEVPFESVSIPDSVPAGGFFVIDAKLHDLGCYQTTDMMGRVLCDTIYLTAIAEYDECGCPSKSNGLEIAYKTSFDTVSSSKVKHFVYWQVTNHKDSIKICRDSVVFY